jgi:hypothetical protein
MERTVIIDAQVNTGNSVEDLEKVAQGFDDVAEASSKSNSQTQKQFDDLNKKIDKGGLSVKDYSKAIKEYTSIALAAGRTSPIGVEALNRAAQMKDELGDLKNEVTRLGADGRKLQASLQLGGTVVAGYQAFTGVTAMLGVENEGLLKTMTMLQAAQGTLQAIETVRLALEKESMLMIELRNAKTKVATALQWLFNAAMSANPMGLVVIAIGALIAGLGILVSKMGGVTVVFKAIGEVASSVMDGIVSGIQYAIGVAAKLFDILTFGLFNASSSYESYTKSVNDASSAEKKRLENAEKERALIVQNILELKKKIKILDEEIKIIEKTKASVIARYDQEIRLAQASGKETYAIEKQKLADIIDFTEKEIQLKLKKYLATKALQQEEKEFAKNLFGENMASLLADEQANIKANNVKVRELAELRKQVNDAKDTDEVLDATRRKENSDAFAKSEETKTAKLKEEGDKRKELVRQLEDQIAANIKDADERAITQLQLKHQRERDALIEKYGKDSALLGNLERIQAGEKNKLLDEIEAGDAEEKVKRDKAETDANKVHTDQLLVDVETEKKTKKELDDQEVQDKKDQQEAIFGAAQAGINGLKSIGEMAIKDQKKAQQFSALMTASQMALDSAKAITGAVAATAGVPFPANIPAIATAVAAVLGNIATAVKAFKQAKVGSAPSVSAPSASGVGSSSNASENEVVRRGANGETFTGDQPALTRPPMARVSVLNSELQMVRQEQEAIVEQSTL